MGSDHAQHSFIARLWLERGSNGEPCWRGRIRHVQGRQEIHFSDLKAVGDFVQSVTGVAGPPFLGKPAVGHVRAAAGPRRKQRR